MNSLATTHVASGLDELHNARSSRGNSLSFVYIHPGQTLIGSDPVHRDSFPRSLKLISVVLFHGKKEPRILTLVKDNISHECTVIVFPISNI